MTTSFHISVYVEQRINIRGETNMTWWNMKTVWCKTPKNSNTSILKMQTKTYKIILRINKRISSFNHNFLVHSLITCDVRTQKISFVKLILYHINVNLSSVKKKMSYKTQDNTKYRINKVDYHTNTSTKSKPIECLSVLNFDPHPNSNVFTDWLLHSRKFN